MPALDAAAQTALHAWLTGVSDPKRAAIVTTLAAEGVEVDVEMIDAIPFGAAGEIRLSALLRAAGLSIGNQGELVECWHRRNATPDAPSAEVTLGVSTVLTRTAEAAADAAAAGRTPAEIKRLTSAAAKDAFESSPHAEGTDPLIAVCFIHGPSNDNLESKDLYGPVQLNRGGRKTDMHVRKEYHQHLKDRPRWKRFIWRIIAQLKRRNMIGAVQRVLQWMEFMEAMSWNIAVRYIKRYMEDHECLLPIAEDERIHSEVKKERKREKSDKKRARRCTSDSEYGSSDESEQEGSHADPPPHSSSSSLPSSGALHEDVRTLTNQVQELRRQIARMKPETPGGPTTDRKCFICQAPDHNAPECPERCQTCRRHQKNCKCEAGPKLKA
jgi:hypothetical protein